MKTVRLGYWQTQETEINELLFPDDMGVLPDSEKNLQYNLEVVEHGADEINMVINIPNTKTMVINVWRK